MKNPQKIHIIGAGRLGLALCRTFSKAIRSVTSNSIGGASAAARIASDTTKVFSNIEAMKLEEGDVIWIAVPDDSILSVCDRFGTRFLPENLLFVHSSGQRGLGEFGDLVDRFEVAALHPNQILDGEESISKETIWGLTADSRTERRISELIEALDPKIVSISGENRTIYHLAATFVANYPLLLAVLADRLYSQANVPQPDRREIIGNFLIELGGRISSNRSENIGDFLTGPVNRGDQATLDEHRKKVDQLLGFEVLELFDKMVEVMRQDSTFVRGSGLG